MQSWLRKTEGKCVQECYVIMISSRRITDGFENRGISMEAERLSLGWMFRDIFILFSVISFFSGFVAQFISWIRMERNGSCFGNREFITILNDE